MWTTPAATEMRFGFEVTPCGQLQQLQKCVLALK